MSKVFVGTSGWSYNEWVGTIYPTKSTPKLKQYSTVFSSVEIDSTFYAYPRKELVQGWIKNTPVGFKFTAKLPKVITHEKKLENSQEDLKKFLDLMQPIQEVGKLDALLIQLPPSFRKDSEKTLESFLQILSSDFKFALEFRDKSWEADDTKDILSRHGVANVVTDSPLELKTEQTADWSFIRFHGRGKQIWFDYRYSQEEISKLASRFEQIKSQSSVVYVYFNNHYGANAVENALQLLEITTNLTSAQRSMLNQFKMKSSRFVE
ncbi:MAG: DUF72 domain-containing protein [Thaumarchaeota archaeon]|nr:MAG: DUF72 domain-containing protein [Nitrososphaerota archaeon]